MLSHLETFGHMVQIGVVVLEIDYNWLRGTRDAGGRISTTQIRINSRKLPRPMAVISHVSNVNHWLLSHDNVWAELPPDHPALRVQKAKQAAEQGEADPVTGSSHSAKPDLLQLSSATEDDTVRCSAQLEYAVIGVSAIY